MTHVSTHDLIAELQDERNRAMARAEELADERDELVEQVQQARRDALSQDDQAFHDLVLSSFNELYDVVMRIVGNQTGRKTTHTSVMFAPWRDPHECLHHRRRALRPSTCQVCGTRLDDPDSAPGGDVA